MKNAWPYRKILLPIVDLLRPGVTPEKIALSIALGAVLGVFPVLGSTTILCAVAAFVLRLNLPAIQMVNFLIYPLQLILFLPFLQAGSRITGAAPITLSMKEVFGMIKSDPWSLIKMLWTASLGAMAIWTVMSPLVIASRLLHACSGAAPPAPEYRLSLSLTQGRWLSALSNTKSTQYLELSDIFHLMFPPPRANVLMT